jgi:hypothetical protein
MSPRCAPCNRDFRSERALQQHVQDSPAHNFNCTACNRHFGTDKALAQHYQNAAVHAQSFERPPVSTMSLQEQIQRTIPMSVMELKPIMELKPTMELKLTTKPKSTTKSKSTKQPRSPTKLKTIQKWSIYPSLHSEVSDLLRNDNLSFSFYEADNDNGCIDYYDTNVMGRFNCRNTTCLAVWTSKQIAITIRQYPNEHYNARVYYQSCKRCDTTSEPTLDSSYAERVAYRLKKWSGIRMTPPPYLGLSLDEHRSDLCEGCKDGHCTKMVSRFRSDQQ